MLKLVYNSQQVQAFYDKKEDRYILKHAFQKGVDILCPVKGTEEKSWTLSRIDSTGVVDKITILDRYSKASVLKNRCYFKKSTIRLFLAIVFDRTGDPNVLNRLCRYNRL